MLKLLIIISAVILSISYAGATTCQDLQQSQLLSLNERMNQMIDTISALLPTPSKKSSSPVTPTLTPSVDYTPSSTAYESTYYTSPPAYTSSTSSPYIMYVSPPYAPTPNTVPVSPHVQPNPISTLPRHYSPIEPEFHPEYVFPPIPNLTHLRSRSQYPYENHPLIQYQNSIPVAHSPPTSYPYIPYSFMQPPYLANYNHQSSPAHSPGYPGYPAYPASLRPSIPTYPSHSPLPLPVYMPSNTFVPTYPNQPELVPSLYA